MFGNLFNQKRIDENPQNVGAPPVDPQVIVPGGGDQMQMSNTQNAVVPQQPNVVNPLSSSLDPSKRGELSALSKLDPRAVQVLNHAQEEAKRVRQALISPDQILFGLIYDAEVFKLLEQFSLDAAKLSRDIQSKEATGDFTGQPTLSEQSKQIFEAAYTITKNRGASFTSPEDILIALFSSASEAEFLKQQGIEKAKIEEKLSKTSGYVAGKSSVLDKYGIDMTAQAKNGELDPVTGRDRETERLIHILLRRTKNNPIIIGEAGVGKTAIVESLAQKVAMGQVPQDLKDRRIIQLDVTSLVAGASHRGEFEERLRAVIKEVQAASGQIILFVDEVHTLVGAGESGGAMDASNIIKPFLARGQLQMIGTTTTTEYRKYFEKDKAFERRFQPILVEEPSEEVAIEMMNVIKPKYEKFHNVVFTPESVTAAVHLSKKYIGERYLPDKSVDLLDEAAAEVKLQHTEGKRQDNEIKRADIEKVVSAWTGIPITRLTEDESEKLLHLEDLIHKRLIDQEEAVSSIAEAVRRGRIGLASGNRPIASFIFLGPTGVGKTELAKTLAEIMFGRDDLTIRLDMSEYMEKHEVAKLIGAPPGYVGYEEGGQLTEAVRAKPYSIVLLDEVEKAHPDVFNILLQILEDGRLTDNKGNTISFKNTIIIATSNIGSALIQKYLLEKSSKTTTPSVPSNTHPSSNGMPAGGGQLFKQTAEGKNEDGINFGELNKILLDELHKFFKPELLNRFDELVVFKPLSQKDMAQIAKLGINKTAKLLKDQGFNLQISDQALSVLAQEGYDPVYGARPLRRLIQSSIENPIALQIIGKKFMSGDSVLINYDNTKGEFVFQRVAANPVQPQIPGRQQPAVSGAGMRPVNDDVVKPATTQVQDASLISAAGITNGFPLSGAGNSPSTAASEPVYGQNIPPNLPPQPTVSSDGVQMSPAQNNGPQV